jgi:hypothetical protein
VALVSRIPPFPAQALRPFPKPLPRLPLCHYNLCTTASRPCVRPTPFAKGDIVASTLNLIAMARIKWQAEAGKAVARLQVPPENPRPARPAQ